MKAIVQDKYGSPGDVLTLREIDKPVAGDDEVVVRVRATAVHADLWHSVTGRPYSWRLMTGWCAPKRPVPGTDVAGVVESVGARVTRFKPGDEVFGLTVRGFAIGNGGAFAEYAAAPEQSLALKPQNVTFEQAASVPASGYIAFANLIPAGTSMEGQRVLVNGAGGGVGTIALQMLKARGAHVTAVDAGPKLAMLRSLGADETIDYTRTNFVSIPSIRAFGTTSSSTSPRISRSRSAGAPSSPPGFLSGSDTNIMGAQRAARSSEVASLRCFA